MGKDLKGKELVKGISQESTGLYSARFVDRFGKRKHKRFKKLQECRAWIADATYADEHSDISMPLDMFYTTNRIANRRIGRMEMGRCRS